MTVVWALVLGVTGYLAAGSGMPTAREQTTLAQARMTVDRVLTEVATAAGPQVVAALSAYVVLPGCRITAVRDGTELARTIRLYTPAGSEPALLDRLAGDLRGAFHARVSRPAASPASPASPVSPAVTAVPRLYADVGDFVALRGDLAGPGELRLEAKAGCRTGDDLGTAPLGPEPVPADRALIDLALQALAVGDLRWHTYQASCPGGGLLRTVEAAGERADRLVAGSLPAVLRGVGSAAGVTAVVLARPERYAYRAGSTAVAVRAQDRTVTVTATTACP